MKPASVSFDVDNAVKELRKLVKRWNIPYVTGHSRSARSPFTVLISTILSSRTKDEVTGIASERLFARAATPQKIAELDETEIARLIYPVGFYNTKARRIKEVCKILLEEYNSRVPSTIDELLKLPGVGRKTANLVIALGFNKPGICVDTHVHRITNRWGLVHTKAPRETEQRLRQILPRHYWIEFNTLLVGFGQNICKPISPLCSRCPLDTSCPKSSVSRRR